jgi:hypothetical protein
MPKGLYAITFCDGDLAQSAVFSPWEKRSNFVRQTPTQNALSVETGDLNPQSSLTLFTPTYLPDFSRHLENLSLNLSPFRRETLNFPPSRVGKGVRGLGFWWTFPHNVKSQTYLLADYLHRDVAMQRLYTSLNLTNNLN